MLCRECGATSTQGDSFCKSCGHDLGATALLTSIADSTERPAIEIVREALKGEFDVKNLIGRGGMGLVFRAQERSLKREVALKVLPFAHVHDEMLVTRFTNEARTAAKLEHPHIVPVYRVGRFGDVIFFSMRFLNGPSLSELIQEAGPLSPPDIRRVLIQCAHALGYAHGHGVVHRDVKPDNIIFKDSGDAVVCDFGIARAATGSRLTGTGMALGTPYYMSPEQFRARPLDGRSDIYSLGIVGYQCLTKNLPFEGEDSFAIGYKHVTEPLPEPVLKTREQRSLYRVIQKMMEKEQDDRYPDANALIDALADGASAGPMIQADRKITTPPEPVPTLAEQSTRPARPVVSRRASSDAVTTPARPSLETRGPTPATTAPRVRRSPSGLRRPRRRVTDRSSMAVAAGVVIILGSLGGVGYYFIDSSGGTGAAAQRLRTSVLTGLSKVPGVRDYVPTGDSATVASAAGASEQPLRGISSLGHDSDTAGSGSAIPGFGIDSATAAGLGSDSLTTPDGNTTTASMTNPVSGMLVVRGIGNTGRLLIDGAYVSGVEHRLPGGAHELIVEQAGYERYRAEINIQAGDTIRHTVQMQAEAQCEVYNDTYNRDGRCFDTPPRIIDETAFSVPLTTDVPRNPRGPISVRLSVLADGSVGRADPVTVSDVPEFTIAALQHARTLRFLPARRSGRAVQSFVVVQLRPASP